MSISERAIVRPDLLLKNTLFFFCNTLRDHLNYKTVFLLKYSFQTICQAKSGANRNLPPPMLIERSRWHYRLLSLIPGKTLNWFSLTGDHRTIGSIPTQKLNPTPTRPLHHQTLFSTLWLNWWLSILTMIRTYWGVIKGQQRAVCLQIIAPHIPF